MAPAGLLEHKPRASWGSDGTSPHGHRLLPHLPQFTATGRSRATPGPRCPEALSGVRTPVGVSSPRRRTIGPQPHPVGVPGAGRPPVASLSTRCSWGSGGAARGRCRPTGRAGPGLAVRRKGDHRATSLCATTKPAVPCPGPPGQMAPACGCSQAPPPRTLKGSQAWGSSWPVSPLWVCGRTGEKLVCLVSPPWSPPSVRQDGGVALHPTLHPGVRGGEGNGPLRPSSWVVVKERGRPPEQHSSTRRTTPLRFPRGDHQTRLFHTAREAP